MSRIRHHRPRYPDVLGTFTQSYHLEMVRDEVRTGTILAALRQVLRKDTVFCELGCGTGIFSVFAARTARRVYAVEIDPVMQERAALNFERSPESDRIELIKGDAMEVELPEPADVVLCEMMSIWCIEEPQVPVFNSAFERLLAPGGVFMPLRVVNMVELGHYDFHVHEIELKTAIPLFSGIHGMATMTDCREARRLDFSQRMPQSLGCEVELTAVADGLVNCAKLVSIVQMGPSIVFSGTDSLMPPTVVPLDESAQVKAGDRLRFSASVRARSDLGEASFSVEL